MHALTRCVRVSLLDPANDPLPALSPCRPVSSSCPHARFEYILGTHLYFSANTAAASAGGGAGGAGGAPQTSAQGAAPDVLGSARGGAGVAGGAIVGGGYAYYGKASKKLVFRPVVLNPKS